MEISWRSQVEALLTPGAYRADRKPFPRRSANSHFPTITPTPPDRTFHAMTTQPASTERTVTVRDGVQPCGARPRCPSTPTPPSSCCTASAWRRVVDGPDSSSRPAVGRPVRIISYDHRGHGKSDVAAKRTYIVDQLADDLADVLEALDVSGPLTLVGPLDGRDGGPHLPRSAAGRSAGGASPASSSSRRPPADSRNVAWHGCWPLPRQTCCAGSPTRHPNGQCACSPSPCVQPWPAGSATKRAAL